MFDSAMFFFVDVVSSVFRTPPKIFIEQTKNNILPFPPWKNSEPPQHEQRKKPWLFRLYGIILPNYMGIIINHYEDSC